MTGQRMDGHGYVYGLWLRIGFTCMVVGLDWVGEIMARYIHLSPFFVFLFFWKGGLSHFQKFLIIILVHYHVLSALI
jgi:hypothetical protein